MPGRVELRGADRSAAERVKLDRQVAELADRLGQAGGADDGVDADAGWELVILAGGFALIAYAVWARQSGPAYLGFLNLTAFVLLAGPASEDGPSMIGWPIVMLLVAGAVLAAGMRPSANPPPGPAPEAHGPTRNP